MATMEECRQALARLAEKLAQNAMRSRSTINLNRRLSLDVTDLNISFHGRLVNGELTDIGDGPEPHAKIRLYAHSDDLVALVDGRLDFARAWASGQISVKASVFDLMKLRSLM